MWPTGSVHLWRGMGGSPVTPIGPAMTTLRSVVAPLASTVRTVGIVYIVVQVVIWHSFYTADWWRLTAPALAVAWGSAVVVSLRRRWPSPVMAGVDSAVYLALALGAQGCVPPQVRDDMFSWLVICMSGQLMVPAWYVPRKLSLLLALIAPAAFWLGAALQPVTNRRTLTGAAILLIVVALAHTLARRELYGRAAAEDEAVDEAAQAASEQYAVLSRNIERREHERLLHDTVLNTLTALARASVDDVAGVASRCRRDVALIEEALGDPDGTAAGAGRPASDLVGQVRSVVAELRGRGLTVHIDIVDEVDEVDEGASAVPVRVTVAISNATREALSNVAAHAGTGEAWVAVRLMPQPGDAAIPCRLQVIVRDRGAGFDPARVNQGRLGLRRSIAERAADCGGRATIWSAPGEGTVVSLSWPAAAPPDEPGPAGLLVLADRAGGAGGAARDGGAARWLSQESASW
jgi:signal transduction histidine kinase